MGTQRTSFAKLQREKAKKEKAVAKREKRLARSAEKEPEDTVEEAVTGPVRPASELMDLMQALHKRFDDGNISFDDFEAEKAELLAELAQTADI